MWKISRNSKKIKGELQKEKTKPLKKFEDGNSQNL